MIEFVKTWSKTTVPPDYRVREESAERVVLRATHPGGLIGFFILLASAAGPLALGFGVIDAPGMTRPLTWFARLFGIVVFAAAVYPLYLWLRTSDTVTFDLGARIVDLHTPYLRRRIPFEDISRVQLTDKALAGVRVVELALLERDGKQCRLDQSSDAEAMERLAQALASAMGKTVAASGWRASSRSRR